MIHPGLGLLPIPLEVATRIKDMMEEEEKRLEIIEIRHQNRRDRIFHEIQEIIENMEELKELVDYAPLGKYHERTVRFFYKLHSDFTELHDTLFSYKFVPPK